MTAITDIPVTTIDGEPATLGDHKGNVLLVVNVASKCGHTPQYEGLEKIYEQYKDRGFEVLGFPANNFGEQEPGTEEEIKEFCSLTYGVKFPMFSKISVTGDDRHPLYDALVAARPTHTEHEGGSPMMKRWAERGRTFEDPTAVRWNFEKFLVDREGNVIDRFITDLTPEDPIVTKAIEDALAK
ncbi:MAG: glutathione peroxidase [Dehalococcoidia bacterium]|nr:glutathione peroxidase [Dehalococcoidia bacterium]MCB9482708.1 glutathione peroxidase [Dehalococcoidia bacterium]